MTQIKSLWTRYHLESSTRLNARPLDVGSISPSLTEVSFQTKVERVTRHELSTSPSDGGHGRWVINDGEDGIFDAVLVAIGTCGKPKMSSIRGHDKFSGEILHSSQLDDAELEGKTVVVVGSGASGVEAAELCVAKKAKQAVVLARHDKWIIPRNTIFDTLLALQPWGRQMVRSSKLHVTRSHNSSPRTLKPLSFIPEWLIRTFHYRDQKDKSPASKGLFEG